MIDVGRLSEVAAAVRGLGGPIPFPVAAPYATCRYEAYEPARSLRAEVYLPEVATGASAVFVHGGGFVVGSPDMKPMRILASDAVSRGVAVASIQYRLAPRARFADMVDDVVAGVRWWTSRLSGLGLDPARVTLVGQSAGGALSHAALPRLLDEVSLFVGVFPLIEPARVRGAAPGLIRRFLFPRGSDLGLGPDLPYFVVHGVEDRVLPVEDVARFVGRRLDAGLRTELHRVDGAGHGYHRDPTNEPSMRIRGLVSDVLATS